MTYTFAFALLLMAQATQDQPLIIPFVESGSEVWVMNSQDSQEVLVVMPGTVLHRLSMKPWEVVTFRSKSRGYVRFGRQHPIIAWSVVNGTVFTAKSADASAHALVVTPETGVAIASPFNEPVAATFWMFKAGSIESVNIVIPPLGHVVGFISLWIGPIQSPFTVVLASSKPVVIGVARCVTNTCESVPTGMIR